MNQGTAASDEFVPFAPVAAPASKSKTEPVELKVVPKAEGGQTFSPMQMPGSAHPHPPLSAAGKPVVTLQRDGQRVTGIRVECGCGQVIELACSY